MRASLLLQYVHLYVCMCRFAVSEVVVVYYGILEYLHVKEIIIIKIVVAYSSLIRDFNKRKLQPRKLFGEGMNIKWWQYFYQGSLLPNIHNFCVRTVLEMS